MKTRFLFVLALILAIGTALPVSAQSEEAAAVKSSLKLFVDGKRIASSLPLYSVNNTLTVPIRVVSENLGATVAWDKKTQTVTLKKDGTTIVLPVGSHTVKVNGAEQELAVAAFVKNGTTYVPIRFVSELFGLNVNYDQKQKSVNLTKKSAVHEVKIEEFAFAPGTLTIKKGDTVKFTNLDSVAHTATSDGNFDSGLLEDGGSYEITVTEAGEYDIYCKPHPKMKMKLIVE